MMCFDCNLSSLNSLKCISVNNQEFNVNSSVLAPFSFSIKTRKCSCSGISINDPSAKLCVPGVVKNLKVRPFNVMSRNNETTHTEWQETCKCKCRLHASVCDNKQRCDEITCRDVNAKN